MTSVVRMVVVPLPDGVSIPALQQVHNDYAVGQSPYPLAYRLNPREYDDYANLLAGLRNYTAGDEGEGLAFNGIPVLPHPRAPRNVITVVYPQGG